MSQMPRTYSSDSTERGPPPSVQFRIGKTNLVSTEVVPIVMASWEKIVRVKLPGLREATVDTLRTITGQTLNRLISILANGERTGELLDRPPVAAQYVSVAYQTLRDVITEVVERYGPISKSFWNILLATIDCDVNAILHTSPAKLPSKKAAESQRVRAEEQAHFLELARLDLERLREERDVRERFVAMLTHDLRHPLTVGLIASDILLNDAADAVRVRDLAQKLKGSMIRAERMVRDLLDANAIRIGQSIHIRVADLDMTAILRKAIDELNFTYGQRFALTAPEHVPGRWDGDVVTRIIHNLAENAVKYGSSASPVSIRCWSSVDRVFVAVHNEGSVITSTELATIFKPYHRSPGAPACGRRGWGLGLTLVRGLCEAHRGTVRVRSGKDLGTEFIIDLPRDVGEEPVDEVPGV